MTDNLGMEFIEVEACKDQNFETYTWKHFMNSASYENGK